MNLEKYRKDMLVYVDTSVISGIFDHAEQTQPFWDAVANEEFRIIVSDILTQEIGAAPEPVRQFFNKLPSTQIQKVELDARSKSLAAEYIAAGVVQAQHINDCLHIALATVHHADYLVSWNFKHIVNANKIRGYNAVNFIHGYSIIQIITPYILINGDNDENKN